MSHSSKHSTWPGGSGDPDSRMPSQSAGGPGCRASVRGGAGVGAEPWASGGLAASGRSVSEPN